MKISFSLSFILAVLAAVFGFGLLGGCSDQAQNDNVMQFLREAGADGHLSLSTGGSPIAAGMKQVFFLGPENATLSFDGKIDFARPVTIDNGDE